MSVSYYVGDHNDKMRSFLTSKLKSYASEGKILFLFDFMGNTDKHGDQLIDADNVMVMRCKYPSEVIHNLTAIKESVYDEDVVIVLDYFHVCKGKFDVETARYQHQIVSALNDMNMTSIITSVGDIPYKLTDMMDVIQTDWETELNDIEESVAI